jgi:hypothetical protein
MIALPTTRDMLASQEYRQHDQDYASLLSLQNGKANDA